MIDIGRWSICGVGRLERFYSICILCIVSLEVFRLPDLVECKWFIVKAFLFVTLFCGFYLF